MTNERDREIAAQILKQLGARAMFMMGARNPVAVPHGVEMKISSPVGNRLMITLEGTDTYSIGVYKQRGQYYTQSAAISDVYSNNMHRVISDMTKLALSL
jgi:hypothetical protein